jgi:hypothetical protein
MIYPYIKVNSKVAEILGVADQRPQFEDGSYMLWKFDLMAIGGNNDETIRKIGGVGMTSAQVRAEQQGETTTPLPEPEDPQYRVSAVITNDVEDNNKEE